MNGISQRSSSPPPFFITPQIIQTCSFIFAFILANGFYSLLSLNEA